MVSYNKLVEYDRTILSRWFFKIRIYKFKYLFKKLSVLNSVSDKGAFLTYDKYNKKMAFLEQFNFQQKIRKENIKNINSFAVKRKKNKLLIFLIILCLITPFTNWLLIPLLIKGGFFKKYKEWFKWNKV